MTYQQYMNTIKAHCVILQPRTGKVLIKPQWRHELFIHNIQLNTQLDDGYTISDSEVLQYLQIYRDTYNSLGNAQDYCFDYLFNIMSQMEQDAIDSMGDQMEDEAPVDQTEDEEETLDEE